MSDLTPETVEAALSIRGPGGISQSRTLTGSDRVIREAAQKYANPDYEAAARTKYYNTVNRQVTWCEWDDLEDDEREELVADMRPYVDAALGVTEAK